MEASDGLVQTRWNPDSIGVGHPSTVREELLNPVDFVQNPVAGASAAAKITGTTASLKPDAKATALGTVEPGGATRWRF